MLSLKQAKKAIEAAEKKAQELGISVTIAVVDEHGALVALSRMDGSLIVSPDYAQAKAYTAAVLRLATGDVAPYAVENKPYFGMHSLLGGKLTTIAGGIPIKSGNNVIGAIGVGGSADVGQDVQCAETAIAAIS